MNARVYNFDPTLAPAGKNVVVVQFETEYEYWNKLKQEPEKYKAEKDRIVEDIIAGLNQRFHGISAQIEMRDVATPVTVGTLYGKLAGQLRGMDVQQPVFHFIREEDPPRSRQLLHGGAVGQSRRRYAHRGYVRQPHDTVYLQEG